MTLGAGCQSDSFFVNRGVGIELGLDPMDAMAGRAGGRVCPAAGREHPVDALDELLGDVGVAHATRLRNVGPKDG